MLLVCWWRRGRIDRRDLVRTTPFFLLAVAAGIVTLRMQSPQGPVPEAVVTDPLLARIAAGGWAVWFYLVKMFVPLRLAMLYPRWHVDPGALDSWLPLALLVGAVAAMVWLAPRRGRPLLLALGCYVAALGPVLGIIPMRFQRLAPVSDHLQYIAMPAITALVAAGLTGLSTRPRLRPAARSGMVLLVLLLIGLTRHRSGAFRSETSLWQHSLAVSPYSANAHYNLAEALAKDGRPAEAVAHYRDAIRLDPAFAAAHNNLGALLGPQGALDDAIAHFAEAIRIRPDYAEAHNNWGVALAVRGDLPGAVEHFTLAVRLDPDHEKARQNLDRAQEQLRSRRPDPAPE